MVLAVASCWRSAVWQQLALLWWAAGRRCTGVLYWGRVDATFPSKLACDWQCGSQEQVSNRMLVARNLMKLVMDRLAGGIQLSPPPSKVLLSCDLWMRSEGT